MTMPRHIPANQGELELYQVLQRANVLQYYDVFVSQGGDDVRQLCEAGEEEFLEIMALVGMASKPLHVRRLQKSLQEWIRAPGLLQQHAPGPPLGSLGTTALPPGALKILVGHHMGQMSPQQQQMIPNYRNHISPCQQNGNQTNGQATQNGQNCRVLHHLHSSPKSNRLQNGIRGSPEHPSSQKSPLKEHGGKEPPIVGTGQYVLKTETKSSSPNSNHSHAHSESSPEVDDVCLSPRLSAVSLTDTQIKSIREASMALVTNLPPFSPKPLNQLRKLQCEELQVILSLPLDDESRLNGIRKYSAIYGRFDSKRKYDKPMTLHEISVNEAAAQLCHLVPELLTRRDELFPLARQVVRDSGSMYIKGHSSDGDSPVSNQSKRCKLESYQSQHSPCDNGLNIPRADFDHLQREIFSDIVRDLSSLDQELDGLRTQLMAAKSIQDGALEESLHQDINALSVRRQQLMTQQNLLLQSKERYQYTKPSAEDSDTSHSIVSSPRESLVGDDGDRELDLSLHNKKSHAHVQEKALMDVGLRIAHQYESNSDKGGKEVITSASLSPRTPSAGDTN